jgi:hypothetical protein
MWEAIIVRVDDDEFLVRWRDEPNEPRVSRSHEYIALVHPNIVGHGECGGVKGWYQQRNLRNISELRHARQGLPRIRWGSY